MKGSITRGDCLGLSKPQQVRAPLCEAQKALSTEHGEVIMRVGPAYSLTTIQPAELLPAVGNLPWIDMLAQSEFVQVFAQLIDFNATVRTSTVNTALASLGLRPAMWSELVSFSTIPEERERSQPVVGLGSWVYSEDLRRATGDARKSLAYMPTPAKSEFALVPRMANWNPGYRFLGIAHDALPSPRLNA